MVSALNHSAGRTPPEFFRATEPLWQVRNWAYLMRCVILTMCVGSLLRVRHPHGSVYKHIGSHGCSAGYRLFHLCDGACWSHLNHERQNTSWMCVLQKAVLWILFYIVCGYSVLFRIVKLTHLLQSGFVCAMIHTLFWHSIKQTGFYR